VTRSCQARKPVPYYTGTPTRRWIWEHSGRHPNHNGRNGLLRRSFTRRGSVVRSANGRRCYASRPRRPPGDLRERKISSTLRGDPSSKGGRPRMSATIKSCAVKGPERHRDSGPSLAPNARSGHCGRGFEQRDATGSSPDRDMEGTPRGHRVARAGWEHGRLRRPSVDTH